MQVFLILILGWSICTLYYSRKVFNSIWNPCTFMNVTWATCAFLASTGGFNFFVPSEKTYIYIFVFLFVFTAVTEIVVLFLKPKKLNFTELFEQSFVDTRTLFLFLLFFSLILLPSYVEALGYWTEFDLKGLRLLYLKGAGGLFGRFEVLEVLRVKETKCHILIFFTIGVIS